MLALLLCALSAGMLFAVSSLFPHGCCSGRVYCTLFLIPNTLYHTPFTHSHPTLFTLSHTPNNRTAYLSWRLRQLVSVPGSSLVRWGRHSDHSTQH